MSRRQKRPARRVMLGPNGITLTVKVVDGDQKNESEVRSYCDRRGDVQVTRRTIHSDREGILQTYSYRGAPLADSWPVMDGNLLDNVTSEMVTCALAFAGMGVPGVALLPRKPPDPDLFVDCRGYKPLGVEVTVNNDTAESKFQRDKDSFVSFLNERVKERADFPRDVNLGFIMVPERAQYERVADAVIAQVATDPSAVGARHFSGELSALFAQYILGPRTHRPPFTGGAVVNVRGLPDMYETTMQQIAYKRDLADYRVKGRQTWLVVGTTVHLMGPDVMTRLFGANIELGQFDCIVLSGHRELVIFERQKSEEPAK